MSNGTHSAHAQNRDPCTLLLILCASFYCLENTGHVLRQVLFEPLEQGEGTQRGELQQVAFLANFRIDLSLK